MVLRNRRAFMRGRRWRSTHDEGFSLIEVMVALGLLMIVMLSTAGFFVSSLKQTAGQSQQQEATQLASQQLEYTRSVAVSSLLQGRTQPLVNAATASPGIADLSQDIISDFNYDTVLSTTTQAVPITSTPTVAGVKYTVTTFIDRCVVSYTTTPPGCFRGVTTAKGTNWMYRITVDVAWNLASGRTCPTTSKACQFVASTLRDPGTDPCFNVRTDIVGCSTSQPTITAVSPSTVTTGSSNTITLTGTNFQTGVTIALDNGGTVSNVVVASNGNSLTFTLVTDNTAAAIGTSVIKLTNPDGTIAQGTIGITATSMDVTGVTPATGSFNGTKTYVIAGAGFDPAAVVTVDGGPVAGTVTWNSAAKMTVLFNAYPAAGTHIFTVTNPDGSYDTGNFAVTVAPVNITSVTNSANSFVFNSANKTYYLNGTGFVNGATVKMDGASLAGTTTYSATKMTLVLTNAPAVGSHTFTITNPDSGTDTEPFTITAAVAPVNITSVTNSANSFVYNSANKTYYLNGTGFVNGATVKMDGATLAGTTTYSATKMTLVLTNAPAVGSHTFTITNPDTGTDTEPFAITSPFTGTITSITPTTAPAYGSNVTFTVAGTGFVTGNGTITLNGAPTGYTDYTLNMTVTSSSRATFVVPNLPGGGSNAITANLNYSNGTISPDYTWTLTTR